MFIFIKTTSSHEGNLRAERIRNSGEPLFGVPYWSLCTTKKHAHCDRLNITIHEQNKFCTWYEPWLIYKTWQFITLHGNIKFQLVPFQSIFATNLSLCTLILLHPSTRCLVGAWCKCTKTFFSLKFDNNFYQVFH